jgi:hypothetical protein
MCSLPALTMLHCSKQLALPPHVTLPTCCLLLVPPNLSLLLLQNGSAGKPAPEDPQQQQPQQPYSSTPVPRQPPASQQTPPPQQQQQQQQPSPPSAAAAVNATTTTSSSSSDPQQQQQRQPWPPDVPWGLDTVVGVLSLWLLAYVAIGQLLVPAVLGFLDLERAAMSARELALLNLCVDCFQVCAGGLTPVLGCGRCGNLLDEGRWAFPSSM